MSRGTLGGVSKLSGNMMRGYEAKQMSSLSSSVKMGDVHTSGSSSVTDTGVEKRSVSEGMNMLRVLMKKEKSER